MTAAKIAAASVRPLMPLLDRYAVLVRHLVRRPHALPPARAANNVVVGPPVDTTLLTLGVNKVETGGPPWHMSPGQGHRRHIAGRAVVAHEVGGKRWRQKRRILPPNVLPPHFWGGQTIGGRVRTSTAQRCR